MNHFSRRHDGGALSRRSIWLKALAFSGIGALLTILFLLPGCGSDSNYAGEPSRKDKKTGTTPKAEKQQVAIQLFNVPKQLARGETGEMAKGKDMPKEVLLGITREELEAKIAADREKHFSGTVEVFPGITQKELEAKIAANQAKHDPRSMEIAPGMTLEQLEAKIAADRAKHDPRSMEIAPGMTLEVLNRKVMQQAKPESREMFPLSVGK